MKKNQVLFCDEERKYTVLIKKISFKILFVLITVFYENNEKKKIYIYIYTKNNKTEEKKEY